MPILTTLRGYNLGAWASLGEFYDALRKRETNSVGALGLALGAEPAEHKELGESREGRELLVELAGDLRVPKGARLTAVRAVMESPIDEQSLGMLFVNGGDLVTDPRLGGFAKKLADGGIPAGLKLPGPRIVSEESEAFARAAHAAASVLGTARAKELLGTVKGHAGASAALFALGDELPAGEKAAWQKRLDQLCAAFKRAPAAAKRMGLVANWPPFLPEAFAPLIKAAEEAASQIASTDALAKPARGLGAPLPSGAAPATSAKPATQAPAPPAAAPAPPRTASTQHLGTRTLAPAINKGPPRRMSTTMVGPGSGPAPGADPPPEQRPPRNMPAFMPRPSNAAQEEAAAARKASSPGSVGSAMPPQTKASENDARSRLPPSVLAAIEAAKGITLPDGSIYSGREELRFDPAGKRIPHAHRWEDTRRDLEWQEPILPASTLRAPGRAAVVAGPFAARLKSLFDNRPEAVDRLCAAAEARAALAGEAGLAGEIMRELARKSWADKRLPAEQKSRLKTLVDDPNATSSARQVAGALLAALDQAPA